MQQLKDNKLPLHLQAQQYLQRLIEEKVYQPGDQLPSEIDLAAQLGISRPTLREALLRLEQEGLIYRKHGVGTFVSERTTILESGLEVLESLERQARRIGLRIRVAHLDVTERTATAEELERLALPEDERTEVLCVSRVIEVEGAPVAYLQDVVPQTFLRREDLGERFSSSVLDVLLQRGDPMPSTSRTEIIAVRAKPYVASWLEVPQGTALLKLVGQLYGCDDQILDYSLSYFIPGYFKFHVMRRVTKG